MSKVLRAYTEEDFTLDKQSVSKPTRTIKIEESLVLERSSAIEIELEGHGHNISDGILRCFCQFGRVMLRLRRLPE